MFIVGKNALTLFYIHTSLHKENAVLFLFTVVEDSCTQWKLDKLLQSYGSSLGYINILNVHKV